MVYFVSLTYRSSAVGSFTGSRHWWNLGAGWRISSNGKVIDDRQAKTCFLGVSISSFAWKRFWSPPKFHSKAVFAYVCWLFCIIAFIDIFTKARKTRKNKQQLKNRSVYFTSGSGLWIIFGSWCALFMRSFLIKNMWTFHIPSYSSDSLVKYIYWNTVGYATTR